MTDLDLFSCAGGATTGLAMLGRTVVGIDHDADACRTHLAAGHPTIRADLTAPVPVSGPFDMVWASPPCTAFSMAGKGAGREVSDVLIGRILAENWEPMDMDPTVWLILPTMRAILEIGPTATAMENVPPTLPVMHACAQVLEVSAAWSPVWCATSDDKERHVLYRTVLLEWFDRRGIRLVCTDSYVLLTSWLGVTEHEPEPQLDQAPDHVSVASDTDKRGLGLIRYAAGCAARDNDADGTYHRTTLAVGAPSRSRKTPALADSLEQDVLRITYEGETVELPVVEAVYPSWRHLVTATDAEATTHVTLSPHVLGILAKTGREYAWTLHGELGGIRLASIAGLPVRGVAMPLRVDHHEEEEAA